MVRKTSKDFDLFSPNADIKSILTNCKIVDLGELQYIESYNYQLRLIEQIANGDKDSHIIICRYCDEIITLGRHFNKNPTQINSSIVTKKIERGGLATYHGPGQIVCYPILNLKNTKLGIVDLIRFLERVTIKFLSTYQISPIIIPKETGVWVAQKKIASIGVACKNWISYHGLSININTNLENWKNFQPCGYDSKVITNLIDINTETTNFNSTYENFVDFVKKSLNLTF